MRLAMGDPPILESPIAVDENAMTPEMRSIPIAIPPDP